MKVDNLNISVFETRRDLGQAAAVLVADRIRKLLKEREQVNIIFASAPSQNEFLEFLSDEEGIEWHRINAFHMDEYIGLPDDAPQNFGYFLKVRLFEKVGIQNVFYLNGNNPDIESEADRYASLLQKYPTDIVCLGIGENGHIAFNDPHVADFNDPLLVKKVDLDLASRQQQVHDKCFDELSEVPEHALTLTIPALMKATHAYCMVPGPTKAQAVLNTITKDIIEEFPSTILRQHPDCILFIDEDSSGQL
ncbi:glucosamine-6-phosphate deaminase [Dyadobacter luteus]|uniref:Glucosamine-6-phosphate deaminase n=1 Tax=Dyadobacter luteus TaxID=2259619 RepID=A0A3D8Y7I1_9BACT|nr:glucosamine-6-phosphate deaminase [Dyadobacter luteus]REA59016.1 glucosamine-6-phosphate deaminase [Dyadobacter luteus]